MTRKRSRRTEASTWRHRGTSDSCFRLVVGCFSALLVLVGWRVFVVHADARFAPKSDRQLGQRTRLVEAPRGDILARDGRPLARSLLSYDVKLRCWGERGFPADLAEQCLTALRSSRSVSTREADRVRRLFELPPPGRRRDLKAKGPLRFYWERWLARDVRSRATIRALRKLGSKRYRGLRFEFSFHEKWRRVYPLGASAGHVVGALAIDDHGRRHATGLESSKALVPAKAWRLAMQRHARGRRFANGTKEMNLCADLRRGVVRTTLDPRAQEEAQRLLEAAIEGSGAEWGLVLLADARNGDLLALAGAPTFDPEFRLEGDRDYPMTHHARVEPGSIIKPLLVGLALERGIVSPNATIACCGVNGSKHWRYRIPGRRGSRTIRDDHPVGVVSLARVLIESSNIGAVKIGARGGRDFHRELLSFFRLGDAPALGLPLPRQRARPELPIPGRLPTATQMNTGQYDLYTGPSLSFGYQLLVYPLTYLRAFATLITGHEFELRLVSEAIDAEGKRLVGGRAAGPGRKVFSDHTVGWMRQALADVCRDPKGTAGKHIRGPRVSGWLGGKTGTQVDTRPKRAPADWKPHTKASFVGFAPVNDPRWISLMVLSRHEERRFYGGKFVAPYVRDLLLYMQDRSVLERSARPQRRGPAKARFAARMGDASKRGED